MKVLVVDDHSLFREGLRLLLASMDAGIETSVAASSAEGLDLVAQAPADIVLLDWHMEGLAGVQAIEAFRSALPQSRLIVLSGEKSATLVRTAIDNGAVGFIPKDDSPENLLLALKTIASGGIYLPSALLSGLSERPPHLDDPAPKDLKHVFPSLTDRQIDVLSAMLRGLPNKVIARELGISDQTVKTHLSAVFRQLDVQTRTEAVYFCARHGVKIA